LVSLMVFNDDEIIQNNGKHIIMVAAVIQFRLQNRWVTYDIY